MYESKLAPRSTHYRGHDYYFSHDEDGFDLVIEKRRPSDGRVEYFFYFRDLGTSHARDIIDGLNDGTFPLDWIC